MAGVQPLVAAARVVQAPEPPASAPRPASRAIVPQVLLDGVGPSSWNAALDRERGAGSATPGWPAVRVLSAQGTESLFVFPARSPAPKLVASWPRQDVAFHQVRILPKWAVVETLADSAAAAEPDRAVTRTVDRRVRFYGGNGSLLWETRTGMAPAAVGRDFVLASRPSGSGSPRVGVMRLPKGEEQVSWPALTGWAASSPLENFMAVNTIGLVDSVTGTRVDELRLLDLEGTILWAHSMTADPHEFAVSNFGDVAIARDGEVVVFDRTGGEKMRVEFPRNSVARTAITPDGKYVLVAACSPVARRSGGGLWVALYETAHKNVVWSRRNLAADAGKVVDVLEMSLSEDGQRALLRLTNGSVLLLGSDGKRIVGWNLERVSRGEYSPGLVPRRTWLSSDGTKIGFMMPVAKSLADARGWLYRVPR